MKLREVVKSLPFFAVAVCVGYSMSAYSEMQQKHRLYFSILKLKRDVQNGSLVSPDYIKELLSEYEPIVTTADAETTVTLNRLPLVPFNTLVCRDDDLWLILKN